MLSKIDWYPCNKNESTSYHLVGDIVNNYQIYRNEIIDCYYLLENDYIKTYGIIQREFEFYQVYLDHFNYLIHGERMIEKLRGRGYLSEIECKKKYGTSLSTLEEPSKRKKLFQKRT